MLAKQTHKNGRNGGRSGASKAEVKIVPLRFTGEDLKRITAAANASKQTVLKWIRTTLNAAVQG